MIDIENELFTKVATALRAGFSGIFVTGEYVRSPATFPCVMFYETDNTPYMRTQTQASMENHCIVVYDADIYSNKASGKKSQCKAIAKVIDNLMLGLGFDRTFMDVIPNQNDTTIYRMKVRYTAVVSTDSVIYRR